MNLHYKRNTVEAVSTPGLLDRRAMVLDEIVKRLKGFETEDCSLSRGCVGPALLSFELYKRLGRTADLHQAKGHIARILDCSSVIGTYGLYGGIAGIGWLFNHLKAIDSFDELELAPDCCADVDEILIEIVGAPNWDDHFDLISGLVGIGVYALSHPNLGIGTRLFGYVVNRLIEISECDDHGTTWRTKSRLLPNADERIRYPNGNFNLGIAHGIPGVIALLGKGISKGYDVERCAPLLRQSVDWLLMAPNAPRLSFEIPSFGYLAGDNVQARIAWCYGDLSVAIALLCAARSLSDERLFSTAVEIATATAHRDMALSGVKDATLCHGSQGNAQIYRRFYQSTKIRYFLEACSRWESTTVSPTILAPESNHDFFLPFKYFDQWTQDNGYLMGLSGIGLSLADGLYGLSNSWDAPLMTNW